MTAMTARENSYSFAELCQVLGKNSFFVRNLLRTLELPHDGKSGSYPQTYVRFLEKVVALRAFSVPLKTIRDLFEIEKKALHLLHLDSLSSSQTWYLEECCRESRSERCLLLTGYDVGFPVTAGVVQSHLNFNQKEVELFHGSEMGEDVRRVLELYIKLEQEVQAQVKRESRVLKEALSWAERVF